MKKLFLILVISLLSIIKSYAIDKNIPKTEEEWDKAYASLAWENGPLVYDFQEASSKIDISSQFMILTGEDAHQLLFWHNGVSFDYIEMYAYNANNGSQYTFHYKDAGYVKTDDWTSVDPDQFIKEIRENYKTANETRKQNGQPTVINVSWKKKPFLDGVYN